MHGLVYEYGESFWMYSVTEAGAPPPSGKKGQAQSVAEEAAKGAQALAHTPILNKIPSDLVKVLQELSCR
jgi:hypothetical protein